MGGKKNRNKASSPAAEHDSSKPESPTNAGMSKKESFRQPKCASKGCGNIASEKDEGDGNWYCDKCFEEWYGVQEKKAEKKKSEKDLKKAASQKDLKKDKDEEKKADSPKKEEPKKQAPESPKKQEKKQAAASEEKKDEQNKKEQNNGNQKKTTEEVDIHLKNHEVKVIEKPETPVAQNPPPTHETSPLGSFQVNKHAKAGAVDEEADGKDDGEKKRKDEAAAKKKADDEAAAKKKADEAAAAKKKADEEKAKKDAEAAKKAQDEAAAAKKKAEAADAKAKAAAASSKQADDILDAALDETNKNATKNAAPAPAKKVEEASFDIKSHAKVAQRSPIGVDVKEGKTYYWCTCGYSKNQPFCDGSHNEVNESKGTKFKPLAWKAEKDEKKFFCGCKKTDKAPFCDGAHRELPAEQEATASNKVEASAAPAKKDAAPAPAKKVDDSSFDIKSHAKVAQRSPIGVDVKAGKTYYWCTCGYSKNQPFCDGAHAEVNGTKGTKFTPLAWKAEKDEKKFFCGCKKTDKAPFCDGTHKNLPAEEPVAEKKPAEAAKPAATPAPAQPKPAATSAPAPAKEEDSGPNMMLVVGGVVLVAAVAFFAFGRKK